MTSESAEKGGEGGGTSVPVSSPRCRKVHAAKQKNGTADWWAVCLSGGEQICEIGNRVMVGERRGGDYFCAFDVVSEKQAVLPVSAEIERSPLIGFDFARAGPLHRRFFSRFLIPSISLPEF